MNTITDTLALDYDDGPPCPACGATETEWEPCPVVGCDDGYIDLYDEDPNYYEPGEVEPCDECGGHGGFSRCLGCGHYL